MDGVVRVGIVVAGTVVEAWRAVIVGLSRVMVVDAVGAAAVTAARPTRRVDKLTSFIVMLRLCKCVYGLCDSEGRRRNQEKLNSKRTFICTVLSLMVCTKLRRLPITMNSVVVIAAPSD